ncbi:MAG: class I SAM-dependent methyltransferase [Verrucomicrobia bacterium]|nr:class I SAM-dependent methyltransferase [Verrucomicrobiota bacterium]
MKELPQSKAAARKISARGCPVCAAIACEVLHSQRFVLPEGHPLAVGYDVVCCEQCGFCFADTTVSQRDYDAFYARFSKYEDNKTSTGGGGSSEDAQRLQETAACLAEALPDRSVRLLDIGCANGGLLKALRELGYSNLTGIDPSPVCIETTRQLCRCDGFVGSLSSLPAGIGEFDSVILSHVLEHVQDLVAAMSGIRALMKSSALAYLEVPDAARYAECLAAPFQDFNTEHINHFSLQCLRQLAGRHGLRAQTGGAKTLWAAPRLPYPAIYSFFTVDGSAEAAANWPKDVELRGKVVEYITLSRQMMDAIECKLEALLKDSPEVIVWGTGQLAMKLLSETCLGQAGIVAFVDGNPVNQGKLLLGRPIMAPAQIRHLSQPIVVTSILHGAEIARVIRDQQKLTNAIILLSQ